MARLRGWATIWLRRVLIALVFSAGAVLAVSVAIDAAYDSKIFMRREVPEADVALVFGAGLAPGGVPSPVLKQRMDAAIALYRSGKVKKLLVSGDNSDAYHDETKAMRRYAIDRGLPVKDVIGDYAGLSTYDSCYRAKEIFGVHRAVLVTQDFHLPRALFIANSLGIEAHGVAADSKARHLARYRPRELLARTAAVAMVVFRPEAKILGASEDLDGTITDGPGKE